MGCTANATVTCLWSAGTQAVNVTAPPAFLAVDTAVLATQSAPAIELPTSSRLVVLPCTPPVRFLVATVGGAALPPAALLQSVQCTLHSSVGTLVGQPVANLTAAGVLEFPDVGLIAAPGSVALLTPVCTWFTGDSVRLASTDAGVRAAVYRPAFVPRHTATVLATATQVLHTPTFALDYAVIRLQLDTVLYQVQCRLTWL